MAPSQKYRMSFSVGGLMLNESLVIAQSYRAGEPWAAARDRLLQEGVSSLLRLAPQTRVLREVYDRIRQLTEVECCWMVEELDRTGRRILSGRAHARLPHDTQFLCDLRQGFLTTDTFTLLYGGLMLGAFL
ncbi:DUF1819 family protein [Sinirhodobacter populi]|uniref:DUF1819 family protein n=2 Tax=Paenirhodobacter populi TaxID=2306993 RepID=A0A443IM77_9RHOB|nr:DUF1819 family protein [Sinirhodobacter populi]